MLICKFKKSYPAVYVPHLDTLRQVNAAIRRAGLDVRFSEGFNPHARIFFSAPLPVGTYSECEYFCVDTDCPPAKFMRRFNAVAPPGLRVCKAAGGAQTSEVYSLAYAADYVIEFEGIAPRRLKEYAAAANAAKEYFIEARGKQTDVRPKILELAAKGRRLHTRLRYGNINLSSARLADDVLAVTGATDAVKVIKKTAYAQKGGGLVCFDDVFFTTKYYKKQEVKSL